MDIPHEAGQVFVGLNQKGLVAALEEMTDAAMPTIECLRVRAVKTEPDARQRGAPGSQRQVDGIGHQAVREDDESEPPRTDAKTVQVALPVVVVANDNCPGQLVISGEIDAVERASLLASNAGAKRVLPLNVSGAFHSPLMEGPAREMAVALAEADVLSGRGVKVYSNVTSEGVTDPGEWPSLLEAQLRSPVRWTESVQHMIRDGVTTFVECGVGEVLSGLIKRIDKGVSSNRVNDESSLANTLHDLG